MAGHSFIKEQKNTPILRVKIYCESSGRLNRGIKKKIIKRQSDNPSLLLRKALQIAHKQNIHTYNGRADWARQYRTPLLSLVHQMKSVAEILNITFVEVSK